MLRTSRPCAVTTSGASTSEANRPAGTRKCAHTTSGRAARRTRRRSSRNLALPPAAAVEHGKLDLVPAFAERALALRDEDAEVRVVGARVHLGDEQDPHRRQRGARSRSCSPHSSRSTPQISPIVQRARSAARIGISMFSVPRAASRTAASARRGVVGVALGAQRRRSLELAPLGLRVDRLQLDRLLPLGHVLVDADDHPLARLDVLLPLERGVLDLPLHEALLDRVHGAAELVDALDQLPRARLELVGERLDVERAAERIGRRGRARLVREDLLRPERDRRCMLGRQRERLVERVRVQRLRAAGDGRERLDRDAHDVVLGLLRGERRAAGLRVEAQRERLRVRRAEAFAHHPRPQRGAPRGTSRPPGRSRCGR